ncbi:ABC transporter [Planctomycetota bacterium]|nr:ABC transporter [Planctomycetota bacterium]
MRTILHPILSVLVSAVAVLGAADYPTVIRVGYPGVGNDGYSPVGVSTAGTIAGKGLFEEEFKAEGIKFEWTFFKGAGPALNESLANGLLDFASGLGDLPAIVHRASGIETRILAANARRQNTYIVVPTDSPAKSLQDLKGKRLALFKGTNGSLAWAKILKDENLTESDFKVLNFDSATARGAIATKDIDGYIGGSDVFQLRNRGVGRVVYTTVGRTPYLGRFTTLLVTKDFEQKYPQIVQRIVNVWVKEAAWGSNESNRSDVFKYWGKSGQAWADFKEDYGQDTLASHQSPLLDDHFWNHYRKGILAAHEFKLIRKTFDLDSWVEPKYINEALRLQKLENNWVRYDADGNPIAGSATAAGAVSR